MNIYDLTTKALANRRDQIEDMGNGVPGEHRAIKLELERRDVFDAEQHMAFVALIGELIDPTL
jgi:hypothetical protein